jgi:hypothetical protein
MEQSGNFEDCDMRARIAPSRVEDARKRAYVLIRATCTVRGSKFAK